MVKENTKCPRCEMVTDLYRGSEGQYLCLHCWAEKKNPSIPARGNGKIKESVFRFQTLYTNMI